MELRKVGNHHLMQTFVQKVIQIDPKKYKSKQLIPIKILIFVKYTSFKRNTLET